MTLREELKTLAENTGKTFRQTRTYPSDELGALSKIFGIDTHELAFIYEAAVHGKLERVRGIDLDKEAAEKPKEPFPVAELRHGGLVPVEEVDDDT